MLSESGFVPAEAKLDAGTKQFLKEEGLTLDQAKKLTAQEMFDRSYRYAQKKTREQIVAQEGDQSQKAQRETVEYGKDFWKKSPEEKAKIKANYLRQKKEIVRELLTQFFEERMEQFDSVKEIDTSMSLKGTDIEDDLDDLMGAFDRLAA